jgi:hypothetical protein
LTSNINMDQIDPYLLINNALADEIEVSYMGQQAAKEIDDILMGPLDRLRRRSIDGWFLVCYLFCSYFLTWFSSNM